MVQDVGPFRLVNDPGHWGARDLKVLILGMSKGNTQSKAFASGDFDGVAFKGIRHRILLVLQSVGVLTKEMLEVFEKRFLSSELDFSFASVVRCSITGLDKKRGVHTAVSPNVIPAFSKGNIGNSFVNNCINQHLVELPERTSTVILLGNTDAYVSAMSNAVGRLRGRTESLNQLAYVSKGVRFVHVAHPSKGNGHFGAFIRGEGKPGLKRDLAHSVLEGVG